MMIDVTVPPKLIVCDLDQGVLADVEAQSNLLESWMVWADGSRPLLLFHSRMSIDELDRDLPTTTLPPADFLVGAGVSMLARLSRWQNSGVDERPPSGPWARRAPDQLIEDILSQARLEMSIAEPSAGEFPRVQSAALTASGLLVSFGISGKRRQNPNAVISWILKQLQFDPSEVRRFTSPIRTMRRQARLTAR
jgi:hypothetical protein